MKICCCCKTSKALVDFPKRKYGSSDGHVARCRPCMREYYLKKKWENIDEIRIRQRISRRKKYAKNPQKDYAIHMKWRLANPEKYRASQRRSCLAWNKRKRLESPAFRTSQNLKTRIYTILKGKKRNMTRALIGCSPDELVAHIKSKFLPGMSWDNYGRNTWHIDHIRPCSSFNLLDPQQQKECFHYTNLQPLWAKDNLKKSDSWHPSTEYATLRALIPIP